MNWLMTLTIRLKISSVDNDIGQQNYHISDSLHWLHVRIHYWHLQHCRWLTSPQNPRHSRTHAQLTLTHKIPASSHPTPIVTAQLTMNSSVRIYGSLPVDEVGSSPQTEFKIMLYFLLQDHTIITSLSSWHSLPYQTLVLSTVLKALQ